MAGWIVDKTPLIAIKHDLLRQARVGDALLGLLGLGGGGSYISLVPGGISTYLPYEKKDANTGMMARKFDVLLIGLVNIEICKKVAALQMGNFVFKKVSEVPYDGVSTPAQWVFSTAYTGTGDVISL